MTEDSTESNINDDDQSWLRLSLLQPENNSTDLNSTSPDPDDSSTQSESNNINTNMAGPKLTQRTHKILIVCFVLFTFFQGYMAATQPMGAGWRFFSWHPFLMTAGFVGLMGAAAATKKMGGYANTKAHGVLASLGSLMSLAGLYVIYKNKENMGKDHLTSYHSIAGISAVGSAVMFMIGGSTLLHPDFGIMKTSQDVRWFHKNFGRLVIFGGWITCFTGLMQLTQDPILLVVYGMPLLALAPVALF